MSLERAYQDSLDIKETQRMDTDSFKNCKTAAKFIREHVLKSPTPSIFNGHLFNYMFDADCQEMKTLFKDLKKNNVDVKSEGYANHMNVKATGGFFNRFELTIKRYDPLDGCPY